MYSLDNPYYPLDNGIKLIKPTPIIEYEVARCVGIILNHKEMTNLMVKYLKEIKNTKIRRITGIFDNEIYWSYSVQNEYLKEIERDVNNMVASRGALGYGVSGIPFIRTEYITNINITKDKDYLFYFDALSNPCHDMANLKIVKDSLIQTKSKKKWDENITYSENGDIADQYLYILPVIHQPYNLTVEDRDKYISKSGVWGQVRTDVTPSLEDFAKAFVGLYLPKAFPYKTRIVLMEYMRARIN